MRAMEEKVLSTEEVTPEVPPSFASVLILRALSLGLGYGLWQLTWWLNTDKPTKSWLYMSILAIVAATCIFFLFVAISIPGRVVKKIWKAIGKIFYFVLLFS